MYAVLLEPRKVLAWKHALGIESFKGSLIWILTAPELLLMGVFVEREASFLRRSV